MEMRGNGCREARGTFDIIAPHEVAAGADVGIDSFRVMAPLGAIGRQKTAI